LFRELSMPSELLRDKVRRLSRLSPLYMLLVFVPSLLTTVYWGVWSPRFPDVFVVYALSSWITVAALYARLRRLSLSQEVFLFTRPQPRDWMLALAAFLIGVFGAYPIAQLVSTALGVPMRYVEFSITSIESLLTVFFYSVVTAPFAEEILFRGLGVGYLVARGVSPLLSGALTLVGFAFIHLPPYGLGGVLFILLWGTLPTMLRLWRNSLTPGWLMHVMNNLLVYILLPLSFQAF